MLSISINSLYIFVNSLFLFESSIVKRCWYLCRNGVIEVEYFIVVVIIFFC